MPIIEKIGTGFLLMTAVLCATGCEPKHVPSMTVAELMEDRVTLDGVLIKCNDGQAKARNDTDCRNARVAIERLAQNVDPKEAAKHTAEFEHSREQLRQAQERLRDEQESKTKVDAYNLPMVPVDPVPPKP